MVPVIILNKDPHAIEMVGMIPAWLDEADPRPAREQLDKAYQHGGGWRPFKGFKLRRDGSIKYPGDPAHKPFALMKLRKELVFMYQHSWVLILQPDRQFEICRMD